MSSSSPFAFGKILRDSPRRGVVNTEVGADTRTTKIKLNMKTRNLLIALSVAALATANALAVETLLPPKAAGQTKTVSGYNADPNLAATGLKSAPPRVVDSKAKTVPGKSLEVTSSLTCSRKMSGSPKMIGACTTSSADNMSCCAPAPGK